MIVRMILAASVTVHVVMVIIKWHTLQQTQRGWSKQVVISEEPPVFALVAALVGYFGWFFGSAVYVARPDCFIHAMVHPIFFSPTMGVVALLLGHGLIGWTLWAIGGSWGVHPKLVVEHQLITHGPYRFIRNPLYTGLHLMYLGTFLLVPSWIFMFLLIAAVVGNSIRARVEERVLLARYNEEYTAYAKSVGRFFPKLRRRSEPSR